MQFGHWPPRVTFMAGTLVVNDRSVCYRRVSIKLKRIGLGSMLVVEVIPPLIALVCRPMAQ